MVVTTRSQAKKAEKLGVSESKFESGEINGKTWRDWMTNWTVMHKARELWIQEIFCEKQRAENPALLRTHKLRYVARREWDSIADTEKAPFITKALDALAPGPVLAGALTMKVVRKTSKQTSESEYCHACASFREDFYENHFMTHSDYKLTEEVRDAASRTWASLDEGARAAYFAEGKKREADSDEVFEYLQHNETYKARLLSYMF
ncbi:unnamed protein product [Cuscuta campestris]|uniref:Uncharacterized protein n=1 Tax=Cuscuta campestris TaxID=132261 RepID=A0A484K4B8_9ASTE|nr:unnamed protein product [Cuscuta campestris]